MTFGARPVYRISLDRQRQSFDLQRGRAIEGEPPNDAQSFWLADFDGAPAQVTTVDGPFAWAELALQKQLGAAAEGQGQVKILTHYKRKLSPNKTEIFYTPVAQTAYQILQDQAGQTPGQALVFDLYGLLYRQLAKFGKQKLTALILAHNRWLELVIGREGRVYQVGRLAAFDETPEQRLNLTRRAAEELAHFEKEHQAPVERIILLTHLEDAWPDYCAQAFDRPLTLAPEIEVELGGQWRGSGLLRAFQDLPQAASISPRPARFLFGLARLYPRLALILIVFTLIFAGGWRLLETASHDLERDFAARRPAQVRQISGPPPAFDTLGFHQTLGLAKDLEAALTWPTPKTIYAELTSALPPEAELVELSVQYPGPEAVIQLRLQINQTAFQAAPIFQTYLRGLSQRGYKLVSQEMQAQAASAVFSCQLVRSGL